MSAFREWAFRNGVGINAVLEWERLNGVAPHIPDRDTGAKLHSEAWVQSKVFLEADAYGFQFFRNNVGAYMDKQGREVRYGLANESKKQNEAIKSSDLIGWRSLLIQPHHVGQVIAQFAGAEIKKVGWSFSGDEHETAQAAWGNLLNARGGWFRFISGPGQLK